MKNLVVGVKPSVGPVLKIMRDDADDPFSTPNTNYGKFLFNSEVQKVGYIEKIMEIVPDFTTYPATGGTSISRNFYYYPSGSNFNNCQAIIASFNDVGNQIQQWQLLPSFFGRSYQPLVEMRVLDASPGNIFSGPYVSAKTSAVNSRGFFLTEPAYTSQTYYAQRTRNNGGTWDTRKSCVRTPNLTNGKKCIVTCFNLPDYSAAIPDYSATPGSGQEVIRISGSMCRVALPGRTVSDTDPDHYILHESKIPAKVLKSGEVAVALSGTATITLPLAATSSTYMDFMARRTSDSSIWTPPFFNGPSEKLSLSFTYEVSGTTITITNTSDYAITIRYAVCAADKNGFTTGGEKILWRGNDGVSDFVQIKRPGSSDTSPTLNDIMIDTRLSYLPILAEGYLAWPADFPTVMSSNRRFMGERKATVSFTNPDGLLPFVKCGAIFAGKDNSGDVWGPLNPLSVWGYHEVASGGSYSGRASGASTWANVTSATSVDFYASGGNPKFYLGGTTGTFQSTMTGLRYYIFGIPQ